ncbi:MAG: hypothetical protein GC201_03180 [Alphaproteobacteria bacterium]|nr:hypothetical protein [Alphaproteobacteria bacterium]
MSVHRLTVAWKRHGPLRFAWLVLYNLWYAAMRLVGLRGVNWTRDADFDERYGVDTARPVEVSELREDAEAARFAHRYQATSVEVIRSVIGSLGIDFERYSFIDYGSGKGRVLLVASDFPFRRIVGVEFSRQLHEICRANIARYRGDGQRCFDLESVHTDAGTFAPPDGPLVCYFYNPFGRDLMARVAATLADRAARDGQPVLAVYVEPELAEAFSADRWTVERREPGYVIFAAR